MRNNGSRRGGSKKERDYIEYEGGRMTRNGLSANHLLNFSLPEREKQQAHHHGKKKKNAPTRTQMEYLHANYRFVIAPLTDDTAVSCWDVETLTEWKSVEQVLLWYDELSPATCPICLDSFRAPKITRCGHIFCWPCILRYLSMTDKYWRRCPMCFESVQKGQLRSVRLESVHLPPQLDSQATFQFLQRPKASLFPHIHDSTGGPMAPRKRVRKLPTVYDEEAKYARILESTKEYVVQLALSEMRDLEALDAECRSSGDIDTLPFVEEAMKATSGRLAGYDAMTDNTQSANGFQSFDGLATGDLYSFYQLQNGCYVVLHPLNVKCLTKEFAEKKDRKPSVDSEDQITAAWAGASSPPVSGRFDRQPLSAVNYELLPNTIQGRVLDVEHLVMDDDVQKRYRFLGHLPKFCDFYVCELDLSDILSPETIQAFKGEFKKREKVRRAKREAEKKSKKNGLSGAEATTRSSPVFRQMPAFSLDEGAAHWPAPAELSLNDSFDGAMQVNDTSGDEELAAALAASSMMSPPFGASTSTYAVDDGVYGSFATITRNSGYFPPLGGSTNDTSSAPATSSPMWGASSPPLLGARGPGIVAGGSKKKGAMKKGTQLLSTAQRRSYR